jgi:hypothetical protein
MTDVICLSILQTEINSGFEGLQVTITIRNRDPGLIIRMSQNDYVSVAVLSKIVVL